MRKCDGCGETYEARSARSMFCTTTCGKRFRGQAQKKIPPTPARPAEEVAAWLSQLCEEFDRALRTDPAYVIALAAAGAEVLAKRPDLADAA